MSNENHRRSLFDWQDYFASNSDLSDEQAHRVRALRLTGYLFLSIGFITLFAQLIFWWLLSFPSPPWSDLVVDGLVILVGGLVLYLVKLDRIQLTSWVLLGAVLIITGGNFLFEGSPLTDVPGTIGFFILVALSAVLLDSRRVWVFFVVIGIVYTLVHILGWKGVLPQPLIRDPLVQHFFSVFIWIATAGITTLLIVSTMSVLRSQAAELRSRLDELQTTQDQLRSSQEDLRTTLDSIGDAVITTDQEGRVRRMNPVAETLTGWSLDEAEGKSLTQVFNIIQSKTRQPVQAPIQRVLQDGRVVGLANHTMLIARDGREIQIADSAAPVRDKAGNVIGVVLVFRDVTEEYRRREKIVASELQLRSLYNAMTEGVCQHEIIYDESGEAINYRILDANPQFESILQLSRDDVVGALATDAYNTDEAPYLETYATVVETGEPDRFDLYFPPMDKHFSVAVFSPGKGKFVTVFEDVTTQVKAQKALKEREARLESIFRAAPIGIGLVSERRLLQVNDQICAMTGYAREELIGKSARILYPSQEEFEFVGREKYAQIREYGAGTVETHWQRKDGGIIDVLLSSTMIENEEANTATFTALNITKRKRAEEALQTYAERLEEMVAERTQDLQQVQQQLIRREKMATLGRLAGSLAHELRTPLGTIKNSAYLLNMVLDQPDAEVEETLSILEQGVDRSNAIIKALLDFSDIGPSAQAEVEINQLLLKLMARIHIPEEIELNTHLDEQLPSVMADFDQLARAFENLIQNAIQAMPEGGQLTVATEVIPGDQIVISVADTGVGISAEQMEQIFEPLFSTKTTGIGLGLSLAKNLVAAHGGHIEVESEGLPGKGSTFQVYLPIEPEGIGSDYERSGEK